MLDELFGVRIGWFRSLLRRISSGRYRPKVETRAASTWEIVTYLGEKDRELALEFMLTRPSSEIRQFLLGFYSRFTPQIEDLEKCLDKSEPGGLAYYNGDVIVDYLGEGGYEYLYALVDQMPGLLGRVLSNRVVAEPEIAAREYFERRILECYGQSDAELATVMLAEHPELSLNKLCELVEVIAKSAGHG